MTHTFDSIVRSGTVVNHYATRVRSIGVLLARSRRLGGSVSCLRGPARLMATKLSGSRRLARRRRISDCSLETGTGSLFDLLGETPGAHIALDA